MPIKLYSLTDKFHKLGVLYDKIYQESEKFEDLHREFSNLTNLNRSTDSSLEVCEILFASWGLNENLRDLISSCSAEEFFSYSWNTPFSDSRDMYLNTTLPHMKNGYFFITDYHSDIPPFPNVANIYRPEIRFNLQGEMGDYVIPIDRKIFLSMVIDEINIGIYDRNVGVMQAFRNFSLNEKLDRSKYREFVPSILLFMLQLKYSDLPKYAEDVVDEFYEISLSDLESLDLMKLSEDERESLRFKVYDLSLKEDLYSEKVIETNNRLKILFEDRNFITKFDPYILENVYGLNGPSNSIRKFKENLINKLKDAANFNP